MRRALLLLSCASLAGCLVGPNYRRPAAPTPVTYKETQTWAPANPSDAADRRDWWTVFNDPTLNSLEARVEISNQNIIAAEAAYRQAVALVRVDRAALFPTISADAGVSESGIGFGGSSSRNGANTTTTTGAQYRIGLGGSWAPDLWGGIRRTIEGARANAQASAAQIANARLSAQSELALDYIQMRQDDEQIRLLNATVAGYQRSVTITQNKYNAGVSAKSDLLSARTQLAVTQADAVDLVQQRAKLEHAIAILVGEPPAALSLAATSWTLVLPTLPPGAPSTLLERRPDIATAERNVAAANAQIGVQTAAYYPSLSLTGSGDFVSGQLGQLFNASSFVWSVGASAAETLLDFGARRGRVAQARAAYDQTVANYRQTVLTAFQQVEDNLAAQRVLAREEVLRRQASVDANANEVIARNQYESGQTDFTAVVVAQATALSARTTLLNLQATRLATAVDLIQALGGGWRESDLPSRL